MVRSKHHWLLVVFVNMVCSFNGIEFTEKGICRIEFKLLGVRFLKCQWMIAQMVERLLCTRRTRVQIPAPAPYEITL